MSPKELFDQNQKLVHFCMKGVRVPPAWYDDCIQEGLLELWRVCQTFDSDKGYTFATYAIPCVRGAIMRFCREKISTIKIPRSIWYSGRAGELQIGSLDALVDAEKSEGATFGDLISAEPDFYPTLFEDTIDDFLRTIPAGRHRDIAEEVLYGLAFGDKPEQKSLAEKYHLSQPQVSRLSTRAKEDFKRFLQEIDTGGE
jgi:RNA polymerase sigma factor (sigma-70 family)